MRVICWLATVGTMLTAFASLPVSADWLEFRGPTGQGHTTATGLPVSWSETENLTWKVDVPGLAWSSPVIKGDFIYLTNAVEVNAEENEYSLRTLCLEKKTGKQVWDIEVFHQAGKVPMHKKNSHASPTPIIEGDRMYVHFGPHGTAALDLSGKILWSRKIEYSPTHGNGGSPALAGDVLVICCDGSDQQFVIGLNTADGEILWRTPRDTEPAKGFSFSTPLIIEVNGQQQAVCPGSDAVFAYNPKTGDEIWRVDYPGGYSVTPRPVYGNGLVYVCTGFNKPLLLAIDPTGTGNITETHLKWQVDRAIPHSPSLLLLDDLIFLVSDKGIGSCLNALTGEELWQERFGGNFSASPLYAEGHVYFPDENGKTLVVKATPEYELIGTNTLGSGERTFASFAVDGSALFIRSENSLYRIEQN